MGFLHNAFRWIFSCPWGICQGDWGCRCGKLKGKGTLGKVLALGPLGALALAKVQRQFKGSHKAEERAADIERQERERAIAEQARQEASGHALAEQFGTEAGFPAVTRRAEQTPEELVRAIGPIAEAFQRRVSERLATPPQIPYEDTFPQQFELLRQAIDQEAARRGFGATSGLRFERLGRAGIDLALAEAQQRLQNRLLNQQLLQQSMGEAGAATEFASGLGQQARGERESLAGLMAQLRQQGGLTGAQVFEAGQGRAAGAATAGLEALNQRMQQARARDMAIAQALGTAAVGGLGAAFAPASFGLAAGGSALGRFGTGALQSMLGIGGFSPYAGLSSYLDRFRLQPSASYGSGNLNVIGRQSLADLLSRS